MGEDLVRTGVDDLLGYLQGKDRVALHDAAKALGVPVSTVQAWTDFLVEEQILGIEYKFTKPFIYLNQPEKKPAKQIFEGTASTAAEVRIAYFERAKQKLIPAEKVPELWRGHVLEALRRKREYFFEQASRRNATNPQSLWEEYQKDLIQRCS
jgi:hypothetical protein